MSAPAELSDLREPAPITAPPPLVFSGVLLLAGLLWLRRRRAPRPPPAESSIGDPLAELSADWRRGACSSMEAILRLDTLLREALIARGIPARQRTSAELLGGGGSRIAAPLVFGAGGEGTKPTKAHRHLAELLELCDLVKFAGHAPESHEIELGLVQAGQVLSALPELVRDPA